MRALAGIAAPIPASKPNTPNHWHQRVFTQQEIDDLKEASYKKQAVLASKYGAYNNLVQECGTRGWSGDVGEIAFADMLEKHYGFVDGIHFTRWTTEEEIDRKDFTVGGFKQPLEIDVKTVVGNVVPKLEYFGNVNAIQLQKLNSQNDVNCLVFCQYVVPTLTCFVMGWIMKDEFPAVSHFVKAGEVTNKITANSDMHCVEYAKLRPFRKVIVG